MIHKIKPIIVVEDPMRKIPPGSFRKEIKAMLEAEREKNADREAVIQRAKRIKKIRDRKKKLSFSH